MTISKIQKQKREFALSLCPVFRHPLGFRAICARVRWRRAQSYLAAENAILIYVPRAFAARLMSLKRKWSRLLSCASNDRIYRSTDMFNKINEIRFMCWGTERFIGGSQ